MLAGQGQNPPLTIFGGGGTFRGTGLVSNCMKESWRIIWLGEFLSLKPELSRYAGPGRSSSGSERSSTAEQALVTASRMLTENP